MPHKLRRSQLIEFDNAAAGHEGVMSDKTGAVIVKPCHQSEIEFYESSARHRRFQYYTPEYIGTLVINPNVTPPVIPSGATAPQVQRPGHVHSHSQSALLEPVGRTPVAATVPEAWTPSGGRSINAERGVVLENIAFGFTQPNILDVKLGARLWADDAPEAKRQKLDKVASETTSGSMGFRIAGMRVWQGPDPDAKYSLSKGYVKHDKKYGRTFTPETVLKAFEEYFLFDKPDTPRNRLRKVIKRFIEDLRGLIEVLEAQESRMYSASLLFVYEGDGAVLKEKFQVERVMYEGGTLTAEEPDEPERAGDPVDVMDDDFVRVVPPEGSEPTDSDSDSEPKLPKIQALKVIDFAHAGWVPGQGPDENMLRGIRSVIVVLESLLG